MEFVEIWKDTSAHVFANVILWVTLSYFFFEFVNFFSKGAFSRQVEKGRNWQPLIASLMALIPGSGSTLFLFPLYKEGKLTFAALVSGFIVTMGEAAYIMIAQEPILYLWLVLFSFVIGLIMGYVLLFFFNEERFVKEPERKRSAKNAIKADKKEKEYSSKINHRGESRLYHLYFHQFLPALFCFSWIMALPYFAIDIKAHNSEEHHDDHDHHDHVFTASDEHAHDNGFLSAFSWFYLVASLILITGYFIDRFYFKKKHRIHIFDDNKEGAKLDKEEFSQIVNRTFQQSIFIFTWVYFTMMLVEIPFAYVPPPEEGSYTWIENIGYVVGITFLVSFISIIPGCAVNIIIVSALLSISSQPGAEGLALPFSILLANSIAQDGDAAYPLLGMNKRSYAIMKSINITVGLIIGLAFIPLNGVLPGTIA